MAGLVTQSGDLGVTAGVLSGLTVTGRSTAPTWAYSVSGGHAVTTRGATDGANFPGLDGATDTPAVSAAPATGSRWDLIWIRQRDIENADTDSNAVLGVTSGSSSGTPSKPYGSVPAGALVLAEAQVSAGAANTADPLVVITPVAPRVAARGGIIPVTSTADQTLLSPSASATSPLFTYLNGTLFRHAGSGWRPLAREVARGYATGTTDGNGFLSVGHGLPAAPVSVVVTPGQAGFGTEALALTADIIVWEYTSSGFTVRVRRTDMISWYPGAAVGFHWIASL